MTFEEAKREFEIRYYLWATSEFEKEIEGSFPNLRLFKSGSAYEFFQFMQELDEDDQLILARSRLKKFHTNAVKALGEIYLEEEKILHSRLEAFWHNLPTMEEKINEKKRAGHQIKFASKTKLRKNLLNEFKVALGNKCYGLASVGLDPELDFRMKCCGWILNTHFEFSGRNSQIWYFHDIRSGVADNFLRTKPIMEIGGPFISFNSWLGISSQTEWGYLMDDDIQSVCDATIGFCKRFIEVAPKLLKGLEFEKITLE